MINLEYLYKEMWDLNGIADENQADFNKKLRRDFELTKMEEINDKYEHKKELEAIGRKVHTFPSDPKPLPIPTNDESEFVPNPGESDSTILKIKKLFNY